MQMQMKVVLAGLRQSKNGSSKSYADFDFIGGSVSLAVNSSDVPSLAGHEGSEMIILVSVRPRSVVMFDRPVTLFEPVGLVRSESLTLKK